MKRLTASLLAFVLLSAAAVAQNPVEVSGPAVGRGYLAANAIARRATVAAMVASTDLRDGQTVRTNRYSTNHAIGDGSAGEYVYHATGRTGITADGGFFINGGGGDDYFELVDRTAAKLPQFGALGDGVADDTTAISNALKTAVPAQLMPGKSYLMTSQITVATDVKIEGPGTIIAKPSGGTGLNLTGNVDLRRVTIDGADYGPLLAPLRVGGAGKTVSIQDVTIKNTKSTNYAIALNLLGGNVFADNLRIEDITALDTGADLARGIFSTAPINAVLTNVTLKNVNVVTAGDAITDGIAWGIYLDPGSSQSQQVAAQNVLIDGVGYGGAYIAAGEDADDDYQFDNLRIVSPWVGVADGPAEIDNGMLYGVHCLGGRVTVNGGTLSGGAVRRFAEVNGANLGHLKIRGYTFTPEKQNYVDTVETSFVTVGATVPAGCLVELEDCVAIGASYGYDGYADNVTIDNCRISAHYMGARFLGNLNARVTGNTLVLDSYGPLGSGSDAALRWHADGEIYNATVVANTIEAWTDGIEIAAQTPTDWRIAITGNVFDVTGSIIDPSGEGATNIKMDTNNPNTSTY